jgi:hypothetical protein
MSYINIHLEQKCWFENRIFKNFFLDIYRSQTDYNSGKILSVQEENICTAWNQRDNVVNISKYFSFLILRNPGETHKGTKAR